MNAITAFLSKAAVVLIGLATVSLPVPAFAQAPLVADYQFNETLASSIEGAPSLSALGKWNPFITETVDGQPITVFSFGAAGDPGTGLQLSTAGLVPNDSYSVVVLFNFDLVAGWRKILDSNNRLTDAGLYELDSNLVYYGKKDTAAEATQPAIGADQWVQVVFTRDAATNEVVGYVDGVEQIRFVDAEGSTKIVPNDVLHIFRDDQTTETVDYHENSGGSVARLRLYAGALTAAEVAALDRLPATPTAPPSEPEAVLVLPTEFPPDTNDPFTSATPIDISSGAGSCSGSVSTGSYICSFNALAGQLLTLAVDVTATNPGIVYQDDDSLLWVYNGAGEIVAANDDGVEGIVEGGESSVFNFLVPADGTYYAAVITYGYGDNDPTIVEGRPFNTITGFAGKGLSNIDFNLNISSTPIPATARFFQIALASDPATPMGSILIDGNTILNLVLGGGQTTSDTGLITVAVEGNTLTFDNLDFIIEFAEPLPPDINDVLNMLNGMTATAIIPPDVLVVDIVFSEGQIPGTQATALEPSSEAVLNLLNQSFLSSLSNTFTKKGVR
jgi:hypothetical protein